MRNPLAIHNLKGICGSHSLDFLFLMETKNCFRVVKRKISSCGFVDCFTVDPIRLVGGLCCAWKSHLTVFDEILFIFLFM